MSLDDVVRRGARQVIQQAVEAELAQLLEQYENVKTLHGRRAVVRNGYLPEREVLTGAGPVAVQVPKVRDRSGSGVKFNSFIVPPYVRKSPRVSAALPWLYLKGISTGDMSEALSVLLGEDAKGLSANVVSRLKLQWADEQVQWVRRDLSKARYVYWWVDGIHTGLRSEPSDGQCLLVILGVTPDGRKERVALADGHRGVERIVARLAARSEGAPRPAGPAPCSRQVMARWASGRLGGSVPGDGSPALLVPQDGQCDERTAEVAASKGESGPAGDLDGCHARGRAQGLRPVHRNVPGEISEGGGKAGEGPRQLAGVLRLPGRTLAASAHDQSDRVDLRHRAPPEHAHPQLRIACDLPRIGIQADRRG